MLNFTTWFHADCYGGIVCCLFAMSVSVCVKMVRHHKGISYHFAVTMVLCLLSALLLVPAMLWFHIGSPSTQVQEMSAVVVWGTLIYVFVCGWLIPLAIMSVYIFSTRRRSVSPVASGQSLESDQSTLHPPRHQPGLVLPYVFADDIPWGWLEYKNGNFQGQRLALKRIVATLGRDESCDIWLDDDMASRFHAELAWYEGKCCLTDCGSMNGVLLNGKRIHGSVFVEADNHIEVGSQHFSLALVTKEDILKDQYDPLIHHTWRSSLDLQSNVWPAAVDPLSSPYATPHVSVETDQVLQIHGSSQESGYLVVQNGENMGQRLMLDTPMLTIGCGSECSIILNDASIARVHAQIFSRPDGLFLQDMAGTHGTFLNGELVTGPQVLKVGDVVGLGNLLLAYGKVSQLPNTTMPPIAIAKSINGPMPLRLPSKMKPY
jgi:pSer/pThr/pTyr-binding forkhead associated (FHA) protein